MSLRKVSASEHNTCLYICHNFGDQLTKDERSALNIVATAYALNEKVDLEYYQVFWELKEKYEC